MILSASRRTDIPAFYSGWMLRRLEAGEVVVRNPMNHAQLSRILLSPESVDCIVFWTKNPAPMLSRLDSLSGMGYRFCFQFTLTPYDGLLEPGLPEKNVLIDTFVRLSRQIGPEQVLWRYDPVVLNGAWSVRRHLAAFERLCKRLEGATRICTISFVDQYPKLRSAFAQGLLREILPEEMHILAAGFAETADHFGIQIRACCEREDLTGCGVRKGRCIDREILEGICGYPLDEKPDKNQRPGCGCLASVDIGAYDTCAHGCVYCYATHSAGAVCKNQALHDPESPLLVGQIAPGEQVTLRKTGAGRKK